jgi:hypothetical protein
MSTQTTTQLSLQKQDEIGINEKVNKLNLKEI